MNHKYENDVRNQEQIGGNISNQRLSVFNNKLSVFNWLPSLLKLSVFNWFPTNWVYSTGFQAFSSYFRFFSDFIQWNFATRVITYQVEINHYLWDTSYSDIYLTDKSQLDDNRMYYKADSAQSGLLLLRCLSFRIITTISQKMIGHSHYIREHSIWTNLSIFP